VRDSFFCWLCVCGSFQGGTNYTQNKTQGGTLTIHKIGLFKGVGACWARDIPFSCIYFPTYSYVKDKLKERGQPDFVCSMGAGLIAGMHLFVNMYLHICMKIYEGLFLKEKGKHEFVCSMGAGRTAGMYVFVYIYIHVCMCENI